MTVYFIKGDSTNGSRQLVKATETDFPGLGMLESQDLEPLLMTNIEAIAPDTMVIQNQCSPWADSRRSIDILAIDKSANLVVVELKREDSNKQRHVHMELQAIRYAAMISNMRFDELTELHAKQLKKPDKGEITPEQTEAARASILEFLNEKELEEDDFGNIIKIILVAKEFDNELLTTVSWLADNNMDRMDLRCVELRPCTVGESTILDIQTIFPLPDISDYQIRFKKKRDRSLAERRRRYPIQYDLSVADKSYKKLNKRNLMYHIVRELSEHDIAPSRIAYVSGRSSFFREVDGEISSDDAYTEIEGEDSGDGAHPLTSRFFVGDKFDVFHESGKTYVLTNQWGLETEEVATRIIEAFSKVVQISYEAAT